MSVRSCTQLLLFGYAVVLPVAASARQTVAPPVTLAAAEVAAIANSPDVAAARARVLQAQAAYAQARDTALPSLLAGYAQTPQGNPPGPTIASRLSTVGLQVTLSDLITAPPLIRAAGLTLAATEADEAAAEHGERVKAAGLYYDALSTDAVATARDEALMLAEAQERAARLRFSAGDVPRLDVLRAEVATEHGRAEAATAHADALNAREALRTEINAPQLFSFARYFAVPAMSTPSPEEAILLAKTFRSELRSAELTRQAALTALRAAHTVGIPNITLGASYGAGSDSGVPVNGPVMNFQLVFPLAPMNHDHVLNSKGQSRESTAKADAVERAILLDVAATARSLAGAERSEAAAHEALVLARQELHAADIGYRSGALSSLEVEAAQASYVQASIDEGTAIYRVGRARELLTIGTGR